jgi:hypothetical protein
MFYRNSLYVSELLNFDSPPYFSLLSAGNFLLLRTGLNTLFHPALLSHIP